MRVEEERQIVALGRSKIITLPPWWIRNNKLEEGDKVLAVTRGNSLLLTPTVKVTTEAKVTK